MIHCDKRPSSSGTSYRRYTSETNRPSDFKWAFNLSYKACETFCSPPYALMQALSVVALGCAALKCHTHTSLTDYFLPYFLSHQCHIKINSAYGSMKDISVYNMLGLSPSQIYIVGRPSKKYQTQCQVVQFPFVLFYIFL